MQQARMIYVVNQLCCEVENMAQQAKKMSAEILGLLSHFSCAVRGTGAGIPKPETR
jgi:hypothetical protein